ncbi:uncharacterized protein LOC129880508 isoform X2 [Solanum dulcamara]|uniref:uncharacterized protein LOC129880508 isoform X2 n=1 Tax=Solanum dulcamara TaxID=45834 RepID=UPI002485F794|nr:uncharacterized protein LOC129880508 isoform X2 [Solanum dulcamara]
MGFDEDDFTIGRWQAIQYEGLPDCCIYCKHQGHLAQVCMVKTKGDEENKKSRDAEAENKNKQGTSATNQVPKKTNKHVSMKGEKLMKRSGKHKGGEIKKNQQSNMQQNNGNLTSRNQLQSHTQKKKVLHNEPSTGTKKSNKNEILQQNQKRNSDDSRKSKDQEIKVTDTNANTNCHKEGAAISDLSQLLLYAELKFVTLLGQTTAVFLAKNIAAINVALWAEFEAKGLLHFGQTITAFLADLNSLLLSLLRAEALLHLGQTIVAFFRPMKFNSRPLPFGVSLGLGHLAKGDVEISKQWYGKETHACTCILAR